MDTVESKCHGEVERKCVFYVLFNGQIYIVLPKTVGF